MKTPCRRFALFACAFAALTLPLRAASVDLSSATILELQAALDAGTVTSEKLMQLYLARIEAYDQKGPKLASVLVLADDALAQARALDAERKSKGARSALHGIPILVKDVFDVAGMPTAGGFKPMADSFPARDGFVIAKLREAGAIVFGKLNQSDWFGVAPRGASTLGGQARNPYDPSRIPGYSSSGTGASVAAWFAAAGLGSDTGGSVQIPSADSNLYGMVATQGAISRTGMIGSSHTFERGGPMCRSMTDLAVMLTHMVGFDAEDLTTARSLGRLPEKAYTEFLQEDALRGARIGVLRPMFRSSPEHAEGLRLIAEALERIKKAGALLVDPVSLDFDLLSALEDTSIATLERARMHDWYLSRLPADAPIRSVDEMIAKAGPIVKPAIKQSAAIVSLDRHPAYHAGLEQCAMITEALVSLMDRYRLDALVYPYKTLPPDVIGSEAPSTHSTLASRTGLPALCAPAGLTGDGLPIGLQFLGRPFSEPVLIALGYSYEHYTPARTAPPTTPPLAGESF
ncbi:amidase [Opitutales bacterium ASA1]|uniref:amidase n=1 Tax=Congregicoccus parvus TaxID=3081749 RepID=UPI002B28ECC7|nr:amidase [Opitutales bacterium ASA1]